MNKLPKDKRDRIILVIMATLGVVAGIWFLLISSQMKTLAEVRKEKEAAQQQVADGSTSLSRTALVEKSYDDASTKLKTCETAMAAPNDIYSWCFEKLNTFRLGYNVDIPQFGRETPTEVKIFAKFPYRAAVFSVKGTAFYHDFGKFLADFENAFPYIRVENIELEPSYDPTGSASVMNREKLSFKMDLLTLVRPIAP